VLKTLLNPNQPTILYLESVQYMSENWIFKCNTSGIIVCQMLKWLNGVCCVYKADLDKQLDDMEAKEVAEEEVNEANDGGNEVQEDDEQENKENSEAVDEQQTEEVSTEFDLLPLLYLWYVGHWTSNLDLTGLVCILFHCHWASYSHYIPLFCIHQTVLN